MAGRRRGYGAGTLVPLIVQDRERRLNAETKDRQDRLEFDRRLQEAGIKAGVETGQIVPQFEGGQFRGFGAAPTSQLSIPGLLQGPGAGSPPAPGMAAPGGLQGQTGAISPGMTPGAGAPPPGQFSGLLSQFGDLDAEISLKDRAGNTLKVKSPKKLTSTINVPQTLSQLPLAPGPLDADRNPTQALDMAPQIGVERQGMFGQREVPVGADYTGRQLLGRLTSAVMNDPASINRGSFRRVMQTGQLESFRPKLQLLARGVGEQQQQDTSDTEEFRADIQDAIKAVAERKISKRDAINRLINEYPDKADKIQELEQQLF